MAIWPHNRVPRTVVEGAPFSDNKKKTLKLSRGTLCNFPGLLTGPQKQKCGMGGHTGRPSLTPPQAAAGFCRRCPHDLHLRSVWANAQSRQEGTQGQASTEGRLRLRYLGWPRVTPHNTPPTPQPPRALPSCSPQARLLLPGQTWSIRADAPGPSSMSPRPAGRPPSVELTLASRRRLLSARCRFRRARPWCRPSVD